jgi:hypothetical protein
MLLEGMLDFALFMKKRREVKKSESPADEFYGFVPEAVRPGAVLGRVASRRR